VGSHPPVELAERVLALRAERVELEACLVRDAALLGSRGRARMAALYETAARAQEALSLNVENVDLDNKRTRVRSKGGDIRLF
jgi:site-specific recombinase XerD